MELIGVALAKAVPFPQRLIAVAQAQDLAGEHLVAPFLAGPPLAVLERMVTPFCRGVRV
jgi:hypothetical protein